MLIYPANLTATDKYKKTALHPNILPVLFKAFKKSVSISAGATNEPPNETIYSLLPYAPF